MVQERHVWTELVCIQACLSVLSEQTSILYPVNPIDAITDSHPSPGPTGNWNFEIHMLWIPNWQGTIQIPETYEDHWMPTVAPNHIKKWQYNLSTIVCVTASGCNVQIHHFAEPFIFASSLCHPMAAAAPALVHASSYSLPPWQQNKPLEILFIQLFEMGRILWHNSPSEFNGNQCKQSTSLANISNTITEKQSARKAKLEQTTTT